jgi:predicted Zn-dependent peptidase
MEINGADLQRVAKKYLIFDNMTVGILLPKWEKKFFIYF